MKTERIRERFRFYRAIITSLEEQLQQCRNEAQESQYWAEEQSSQAREWARRAENARIDAERQTESDRWYHESQLRSAISDLERAQSWGDSWGVERATEELKRLR